MATRASFILKAFGMLVMFSKDSVPPSYIHFRTLQGTTVANTKNDSVHATPVAIQQFLLVQQFISWKYSTLLKVSCAATSTSPRPSLCQRPAGLQNIMTLKKKCLQGRGLLLDRSALRAIALTVHQSCRQSQLSSPDTIQSAAQLRTGSFKTFPFSTTRRRMQRKNAGVDILWAHGRLKLQKATSETTCLARYFGSPKPLTNSSTSCSSISSKFTCAEEFNRERATEKDRLPNSEYTCTAVVWRYFALIEQQKL